MIHSRAEENSSKTKGADLRSDRMGGPYWRNRASPISYPGVPNPRDGQEHCEMLILYLVWTWSNLGRNPEVWQLHGQPQCISKNRTRPWGMCTLTLVGRCLGYERCNMVRHSRSVSWKWPQWGIPIYRVCRAMRKKQVHPQGTFHLLLYGSSYRKLTSVMQGLHINWLLIKTQGKGYFFFISSAF